ncbi:amino acid ABC transporter ATP-binding protein [Acidiphilium sp.]|uniref:amino acid ABC transporter ATP-binding protein n=1 Tax=Acidiphilium sp. TaxID=527 RepID=UPI003CFEB7A0
MLNAIASAAAPSPNATATLQASAATGSDILLSVAGLQKSFAGHTVLTDINLTVRRGEVICVLGPSGSGKSTLLRCINWLAPPDTGDIHLAGVRIGFYPGGHARMSDSDLSLIRTRMGMVFQHFALWPHLTVLGNVMEAPVHVQRRPAREVRVEAEALLDRVGLLAKKDAFPARLSGGQKQRVGIARALAMRPEILLFDEPTSALDPELVGEVLAVMQDLARDGYTMLVVTHEMSFARAVADRIVLLDQGRIIEVGAPEEFFTAPATDRARQFIQRYLGGN